MIIEPSNTNALREVVPQRHHTPPSMDGSSAGGGEGEEEVRLLVVAELEARGCSSGDC